MPGASPFGVPLFVGRLPSYEFKIGTGIGGAYAKAYIIHPGFLGTAQTIF